MKKLIVSLAGIVLISGLVGTIQAALVISWGRDNYGQVSNTATGSDFIAIAGGDYHSLALRNDGSIVSWGSDYWGQVSNTPTGSDFTAIAAGGYHSLALKSDGSIVSWGDDYRGLVSNTPTGSDFIAIAGGSFYSLALKSDGSIVSWGEDDYGQVSNTPTGSDFIAIAGGYSHSLALKSDGSIVSWGYDYDRQVRNTPTGSDFIAIAGGDFHSLALKSDGSIVSWGKDDYGQVNDTPTGSDFTAIVGGGRHSLALKSNGSIVSWGEDDYGQVSNTPTGSDFIAIADGWDHSLALSREPLLSITSPNGGEAIFKGDTFEIAWSSSLPAGDVLIDYSVDNGVNWNDLAITADDGIYEWEVTTPASNQYLLRITDANGTDVNDITDSIFTVYSCDGQMTGDLNADCVVDMVDLAMMVENWLKKGYATIFYTGLDINPNWTTQGQWAFGQPAGNGAIEWGNPDPNSGHTGTNVYGVNLNGDYDLAVGGPYCLTAGPFDCSRFSDIKLKFARWLNTDSPAYVAGRLEISADEANWQLLWENSTEITDDSWQTVEYDISQAADGQPEVYIRWSYEILDNRAYPYSGWNIDDVELSGKP